jgi:nuclease S1
MSTTPHHRSRTRPVLSTLSSALCLVLVLTSTREAWAWGAHGHRIATRVAEGRLTPEARAAIRGLLHEGDTLVELANWADHEGHDAVPGSAAWHYVNVPITATRYDPRDCPGGNCVVARIKHFRNVLADPRAPLRERQRALLFLVHLVEDVHQPLHVGDNRDRGGNLTQIQFLGGGTNLHRIWDSELIDAIDRNERAWAGRINPLLTPENVQSWSRGGVEDWATESLRDAQSAYHFPAGSRQALVSGIRLDRDYTAFAQPIIERRLAQAGVRLANELNAVFAAR